MTKSDKYRQNFFSIFPNSGDMLDSYVAEYLRSLILQHAEHMPKPSVKGLAAAFGKNRQSMGRMINALGLADELRRLKQRAKK